MQNIDLSKIKKVFFIGIGGIGISALAKWANAKGMEIGGVNDEDSPKTLDPLRELGAQIFLLPEFENLENIPEADLYVYSDAWPYRGPHIIKMARDTGKTVLSYFEALGVFAKDYKVIAVSGTHGKTTTTAMIGEVLIGLGLDPTIVVGSFVKSFGSNFREGKSDILVVEADEYNKHFLNFNPFATIITNIELDHVDTYMDLKAVEDTFLELIKQTNKVLIANLSNQNILTLSENVSLDKMNYINYIDELPNLKVPGEHNRMNAGTVLALVDYLSLDKEKAKEILAQFSGTWRRLEKRGITEEGVIIYDDYAHHPTEVKASLNALREIYPKDEYRLTVVFQPHLYSRTKALFNEFINAFDEADRVLLLPIYFAREDKDESISSVILAGEISKHKQNVSGYEDFESLVEDVKGLDFDKKEVFITMGAGEAYKIADQCFDFK